MTFFNALGVIDKTINKGYAAGGNGSGAVYWQWFWHTVAC